MQISSKSVANQQIRSGPEFIGNNRLGVFGGVAVWGKGPRMRRRLCLTVRTAKSGLARIEHLGIREVSQAGQNSVESGKPHREKNAEQTTLRCGYSRQNQASVFQSTELPGCNPVQHGLRGFTASWVAQGASTVCATNKLPHQPHSDQHIC